ncbi:MAG: glycoside hydrolase family 127 protein, partial [Oscillospiraceae bacterium]|nr:glycoside hydrolase family 127 protein [Oscillospiraceae bacterium]
FYENPLSLRPSDQHFFNKNKASSRPAQRVEVFSCSCCPPNILRMITAVGDWFYSVGNIASISASADSGGAGRGGAGSGAGARTGEAESSLATPQRPVIYVHQYGDSEARLHLPGSGAGSGTIPGVDAEISITQKTLYPWDGKVAIMINAPSPFRAAIALRVPAWCKSSPKLNYTAVSKGGYLYIDREWSDGDRIEYDMPMEVVELEANPYISQDAGRVALQRGPLIYCVEGADNGERVEDLLVPSGASFETIWDGELLGGVNTIRFRAARRKTFDGLYRAWAPEYDEVSVTAVPYYAWGNREEGEMAVWLRKSTNIS